MKELIKYQNGNTTVTIFEDGTKIREFEDFPIIIHPESIDVKISNYCNANCKYCHENSTIKGTHCNFDDLKLSLNELPAGVELAIGGGNPISHPQITDFLLWCKDRGFIVNLTVNQVHINEVQYFQLIQSFIESDLIKGLGISIVNNKYDNIKELLKLTNNIVYHIIAGVNDITIINELISLGSYCKVLILGYKTFGRGISFKSKEVDENSNKWKMFLYTYFNKCTLSFDNLAIEQLEVRRFFTEEGWNKFYMGDDFTFTMYIDAVKQEYAPTSRSAGNRSKFKEISLLDYFKERNSNKV